jgi:hypothetical protein
MEPDGSLPCSQEPSTNVCPEPDQSSPHPISLRSILILSTHLRLGLPSGLFPSGFPTNMLYVFLFSPIHVTYPAHLILFDLIILITFGEQEQYVITVVKLLDSIWNKQFIQICVNNSHVYTDIYIYIYIYMARIELWLRQNFR